MVLYLSAQGKPLTEGLNERARDLENDTGNKEANKTTVNSEMSFNLESR